MTREEQIRILSAAKDRALKQVEETEGCEMGTEEFGRLLYTVQQLDWMANPHCDFPVPESGHDAPEEADKPEPVKPEPVKPEPAPEVVQTASTMSKEEVRDKLSTYSNKYDHLDVAAIMSEMGYSKLSDIPAARYAELLEKVEAAIKEGA